MAWTGEDTKDVFKKVLGGLIAAAVVAMAYALIEQMRWYFAAFLAVGLLVLVLLLVWRLNAHRASQEKTPARPAGNSATVAHVEVSDSSEERTFEEEFEMKVLKKATKIDQKRLKKEAKAERKNRN
ncbi:MAG: hypothetical protein JSV94_04720 [Methanobacteriota archaeon]|nr:MAG: hypothetical protein JSV94_04720 [Euryarchaeota archaeon]